MDQVIAELPVFMPGNRRDWLEHDGFMRINSDGDMSIRFKNVESAEALVDLCKNNIVFQVSFDYRMTQIMLDRINEQYNKVDVEAACEIMHDAYESAAAENGWETQMESRVPWSGVPETNKATMRTAVAALLHHLKENNK